MAQQALPHSHGGGDMERQLRERLRGAGELQAVAELFKLLADPSRVRIFWLLCHCEECVINISALVDMTSPAVSHHLRQLRQGGLIVSRRDGKEVYYKAADTQCSRLLHQAIEETLEVACPRAPERPSGREEGAQPLQGEQAETVRALHSYLMENMDRRITIEELSRKFLMNPTTLKAVFKEVYGDSLAAHMRGHRMEHAARLLAEGGGSVSQIAREVGFSSQSRFSSAFKDSYGLLPLEYRKRRLKAPPEDGGELCEV